MKDTETFITLRSGFKLRIQPISDTRISVYNPSGLMVYCSQGFETFQEAERCARGVADNWARGFVAEVEAG